MVGWYVNNKIKQILFPDCVSESLVDYNVVFFPFQKYEKQLLTYLIISLYFVITNVFGM